MARTFPLSAVALVCCCVWFSTVTAHLSEQKFPDQKQYRNADADRNGPPPARDPGLDIPMPDPAPVRPAGNEKERTAEVQVYDGQLQLFGFSANQGILRIYHNSVWRPVCDDLFTIQSARVACKQLGYASFQFASFRGGASTGTDSFWLDDVQCRGSEGTIAACPHQPYGTENCYASEGVEVTCPCLTWPSGSVFLRDVANNRWSTTNRGVLYVLFDNSWRPVCDDSFTMVDARVACRQLGYYGAASYTIGRPAGMDSFWLDDLACSGSENYLTQCPHSGIGVENCAATEGVEIVCAA